MLIEASFSGHDPKPKWNLVLLKKFSFNFTSFRHGQKGDVYTKNCSRKRKFYKWKVILQLKICLIDRKIIDSAWVNATIFFCLLRVAFTFSVRPPWAGSNGWKSRVRVGNDEAHSWTARVSIVRWNLEEAVGKPLAWRTEATYKAGKYG